MHWNIADCTDNCIRVASGIDNMRCAPCGTPILADARIGSAYLSLLAMHALVMLIIALRPACGRGVRGASRRLRTARAAAIALGALIVGSAAATEVTLPHGALTLRATLELARDRTVADGVVLMVHGTMGHRDMDVMRHFRRLLGEKGHNTLAINLSLGVDRRDGMFACALASTHRAADTLAEVGAWIDWAARQGARRVTLLGFSRGGQQAAWFAAERPHASLAKVVLLAPIFAGDLAERYPVRFGKPLAPLLAQARALRGSGQGDALLRDVGFLNCDRTTVSAEAFLSYYAPEPGAELPETLPRIPVPTLVVVAGGDEIVRGLDKRIAPLVGGGRLLRMVVVPGSDHFFRDLYGEDAADAIDEFLRS
jgi:pimeloyl-ACP methyl ester carboxylesterase